ncbi:MAG: nitric-oxide reductase large subunit, partial [Caldisphaera sp.]
MPSNYNSTELNEIKNYLDPIYYKNNNTIVVSNDFANAYNYAINYYSIYLGSNSSQYRLKPNLITNKTIIKDLTAYFTWSAIISIMGYTNGFPYTIGLTTPSNNAYFSTFA